MEFIPKEVDEIAESPPSSTDSPSSPNFSVGAILGIVLSVIVFVGIIAFGVITCRKNRNNSLAKESEDDVELVTDNQE
jgi:hypothetical protein